MVPLALENVGRGKHAKGHSKFWQKGVRLHLWVPHQGQNFSNVLDAKVLHRGKNYLVQLYLGSNGAHLGVATIFSSTNLNASRSLRNRQDATPYPMVIPSPKMATTKYISFDTWIFFFHFLRILRTTKKAAMTSSKTPRTTQRMVPHLASGEIGSGHVFVGFKQSAAGFFFPLE